MKLAVILITKNQAWNIRRLIESVRQATRSLPSYELVLVDSASTDKTMQLARQSSIRIIQIGAEQRVTPAAGRYLGYQATSSELILFLDGDMELCDGWLEKALRTVQSQPNVAVVTGTRVDLPRTATPDHTIIRNLETFCEVPKSGGAALFRRSVLESVGTFNPFLYSDEEPELCLRIRHAGHRILRLDHPIAYHYSEPNGTIRTKIERWKRNLYLGAGQNLRYHLGGQLFWQYFRERGFGVLPAAGVVAGVVSFLWSLTSGRPSIFLAWLASVFLVIAADAVRKGSLHLALISLVERLLIADGTVRGFLMKPLPPETYTLDHVILEPEYDSFSDKPAG